MRPQGRVSRQQAEGLRSYYEAYYDDDGRLVTFVKHLEGNTVWTDTYEYRGKTLARRRLVKESGEVIEQRF